MDKLTKLKEELKSAERKRKRNRDRDAPRHLLNWYNGYIDGLEKAIDIIESDISD
jgi:hypothetical protein